MGDMPILNSPCTQHVYGELSTVGEHASCWLYVSSRALGAMDYSYAPDGVLSVAADAAPGGGVIEVYAAYFISCGLVVPYGPRFVWGWSYC